MTKVRVHDELWYDNETGEVMTATRAIKEFYNTNEWFERWTDYYTFTGEYSVETIDYPDFERIVQE
jgi:hypothetical protein